MRIASKKTLEKINILIADADMRMAHVLGETLRSMGFKNIEFARTGREAITHMRNHTVDLLFTDWQMTPVDGIELVAYLRRSESSPNKLVPIIMLTARGEKIDVEVARDTGINEFIVKPYTSRAIFSRIQQVVDNPRNFMVAPTYVGPDRRRRAVDPEEPNRRAKPATLVPSMENISETDSTPKMLPPDYALKKKLGLSGSLDILITEEVLSEAQAAIDALKDESLKWLKEDMKNLQVHYETVVMMPATDTLTMLRDAVLSVKSRAGTFGYMAATDVAQLLYRFLRYDYDQSHSTHNTVVLKHIQALKVIFAHKITGANGGIIQQLIEELRLLTLKYKRI